MSTQQKFNDAKDRLVTAAERAAGAYLLRKYGSAHLTGEPKVELTHVQDEHSSAFLFSGKITCYAADSLLNQVAVETTINENDIEVTSEDVQANITNALVSAEENQDVLLASLNGFRLTDDGTPYLKVSHLDFNESKLGVIGKNEYQSSTNKVALLKGIVKDAFINSVVTFTGEFAEPTINKIATQDEPKQVIKEAAARGCAMCMGGAHGSCSGGSCSCDDKETHMKQKHSWLTNELLKEADSEYPDYEPGKEVKEAADDFKGITINEDMPRGKSADTLVQATQAEEQSALEAQLKVEHEAANELMSLLQGMGYGTAKAIEVTSSKDGVDVMTAIDHKGAVKAVSIPVVVKEGKYILPKKALLSTLIEKGLDVRAKLMEQFDADTLSKLAAIDEKVAYEEQEAQAALNWRPAVQKEANEGKNTMFEGDTDTLTVQKHLLPNHDKLKVGDKISDGSDQWEITNQGGQQNSKGEGDSSLWTLKKCQNPERSKDEPKNKIPL